MRYAIATLAVSSVVYAAALATLPRMEFTGSPRSVPVGANSVNLNPDPAKSSIKRYPIRYREIFDLRDALNVWKGGSSVVEAATAVSKPSAALLPHGPERRQSTGASVRLSALYSIQADTGSNELIVVARTDSGFDIVDRLVAELDVPMPNDDAFGNDAIDMEGFLRVANDAARHRESRRVSEAEFIRMSKEPGTIILDARSRDRYDMLHVKGAISLPFSDISIASLAEVIPDKSTRILIYCNNNFRNNERAFASKSGFASLNLSTYATLYGYGYRNIYELGPRNDVNVTTLPLVSSPSADGTFADAAAMAPFPRADG